MNLRVLFICISMILSLFCFSQQYALIDRGWERPIRYVDTVTKADLKESWYPVNKIEMDTLISTVDNFRMIFKSGMKRTNFNMTDFESSTIKFNISNVQRAYGDRYDIDMISSAAGSRVSMKLSNPLMTNRLNQGLIKKFYNYLKKYKQ